MIGLTKQDKQIQGEQIKIMWYMNGQGTDGNNSEANQCLH